MIVLPPTTTAVPDIGREMRVLFIVITELGESVWPSIAKFDDGAFEIGRIWEPMAILGELRARVLLPMTIDAPAEGRETRIFLIVIAAPTANVSLLINKYEEGPVEITKSWEPIEMVCCWLTKMVSPPTTRDKTSRGREIGVLLIVMTPPGVRVWPCITGLEDGLTTPSALVICASGVWLNRMVTVSNHNVCTSCE